MGQNMILRCSLICWDVALLYIAPHFEISESDPAERETSMAKFLVCTGANVLLPGATDPVPATLVVDRSTGKIIDVRPTQLTREQLILESVEWIDAADSIVLPGLIEYNPSYICHMTPSYVDLALMSTLMNQVVPHGKVSGQEPGLLLPVVSPPWSICL
jgi:hypothetical protein